MENSANHEGSGSKREFLFSWDKHLSYLTLNKVETKVSLDNSTLFIESQGRILGIIPGKIKSRKLPLSNISQVTIKKGINLFDIILGIAFAALGFVQPLFFIVAFVIFWSGFSTKLVITTNLNSKFIIPSDVKENVQRLMEAINEIPVNR